MKYLGIDVGGTNIKYGIIDENGVVLEKGKKATTMEKEDFLNDLVELIKLNQKTKEIEGVGISFPGFINSNEGILNTAGALYFLEGFHLKEYLESKVDVLVEIENDVNTVALSEKWTGNAKDLKDFLCITIGTGIGGAIVIDENLVRGKNFAAGEFGFMITKGIENNLPSECGLSRNAAIVPIRDKYAKRFGKNFEEVSGEEVFDSEEPYAKWLVENTLENISIGLFNLFYILNPEKILIGGAISERKDLVARLNEKLQVLFTFDNISHQIDTCFHKNDAGIIGAVYHYIKQRSKG